MLLVVGSRLGDIETAGYTTIAPPGVGRTLIHVHPSPEELGRVYEPTLGIVSSGALFAEALAGLPALDPAPRAPAMRAAHDAYLANMDGRELPGALDATATVKLLSERLPDDAIVTNGAGNFTVWVHRFHAFRRYRTQLAPTSGAMGYGVPAAVAAKLQHPDRAGRVRRRRRGLPDVSQRARDRGAARRAHRRARPGQRDVRDDPHAPGAPLPRTRQPARTCAAPTLPRWRSRSGAVASSSSAPTR